MTDTSHDPDGASSDAARRVGVTIREVDGHADTARIGTLFNEIWGRPAELGPMIGHELLIAGAHAGHQVTVAEDGDGHLVGATYAFLGRDHDAGTVHLHSHITGVRSGERTRGVGYALKAHQRAWCLRRGIDQVRWTFDPLVARNAWFNLHKLGAAISGFQPDRYGVIADETNAGMPTDRFLAVWDLTSPRAVEALAGHLAKPATATRWIAVPSDIEAVRRQDPEGARAHAERVRSELTRALAEGLVVQGFDRDRGYALEATA